MTHGPGNWKSNLVIGVTGLTLSVGSLSAGDLPKMFATRVDIPERGEVPGYLCVLGTNKFSFITPTGWKPEAKLERREFIFISPELDASLTLKLNDAPKPANEAELREQLLQRFPNASIVDTFKCYSANQVGTGYILEQRAGDKAKVKIRFGAVQVPGGTAEFVLRAPAVRMPDLHLVYGRFLASFRIDSHRPRG